ncbi:hypothetical protein Q3A66_14340 [Hymenobacter sp. BT770]|uniref:MSCRAMM family protein n=1 Tax=Hymenobacter sp. BT770 TaxID=2886942 RepID=UPI001D125D63|nr:hypothetical protein [Hymenobacter sp. BT770]MCC3154102.1 hypothetical protein [Hymenobacter sp. BT770]MDO3416246.1 hypothetical protein [Hymenobacter sp. BT770]
MAAFLRWASVGARPTQLLGLLFLLWVAGAGSAAAQADAAGSLAGKLTAYQQRGPHEKLFLHLDRPVYLSGETMWFKVYAVEGTYSRTLALSSVAYVEVLDAEHQPVLQTKVALKNASGQGSFLLPASLAAGSYTVRAYTSWMKNFGPEGYFHSAITVINTLTASGAGSKDSATYEAQFFPEGGNLVKGLRSKVAFKITDKSGKGIAADGKVLNQSGAVVATFKTLRLGMGSFAFTPASDQEVYTAVVAPGKAPAIRRKLPRVYAQGYVLRLENTSPDQLTVTVNATNSQPETVFLLAHSRQKAPVALQAQLVNGQASFVVSKAQLLEGVSHFTLFNAAQQPLCERLYFQAPQHRLAISAQPDKAQYTTRDKVSVQIAAADQQTPLPASLSMAVYRLDSLNTALPPAIDRSLWLTSDLKGTVENPDYYFTTTSPEAAEAADNLMLTQGWSRFRWEDVLAASPKPFEFLPEPNGLLVRGRLTRPGTNQPKPGVMTFLSSPSRITQLSNSQSDADGRVQFELNNFVGAQEIVVQTDPKQDSTGQLTIFDPFSAQYSGAPLPSFGLTARFQNDYAKRNLQAQVQNVFSGKYRSRFAAQPVDSLPFFGKPNETYLLDKYTRFKVMEEVLREYVPGVVVRIRKDGFHLQVVDKLNKTVFEDNPLVLLDGVPVFNMNKIMAMNPLKIRKLDVIDGHYFQGLAVYDGIVSFTTYKGDLEGFSLDPRVLVQQYEGVQRQREFYAPRYDTPQEKQSRLPDLRNLLYWNPNINTTASQPNTQYFYTGDQAGRYLVVLQGLASSGLSGSTSFVLEVKPVL